MDEKIFTIEERFDRQNNKIYAQTSREVKANITINENLKLLQLNYLA